VVARDAPTVIFVELPEQIGEAAAATTLSAGNGFTVTTILLQAAL
jgi:hypothetical protein